MFKSKRLFISYFVVTVVFAVTFSIGVFSNPNFNIQDFCMNMASEFLGLVFALTVVEIYMREKQKTEK